MKSRLLAMLGLGVAIFGGVFGCASHSDSAAAGGGAGGALASAGGASSGGASATVGCAEHPLPLRSDGTVLSLSLAPTLAGKPFAFGQPNALADGGSVVPLNFRFYISKVRLLPKSGNPVSVDLVTGAGEAEPFGVHLFNAEDDDTRTMRVLVPPAEYVGFSFALGIELACNQLSPENSADPLSDVSQMTWPHTGGFLYLRYEGRYTAADGSTVTPSSMPLAVHMGGSITKELVPVVTVSAPLSISAGGGLQATLSMAMDEMFKGATADIDVSDVAVGLLSTPEAIAGERLRRDLPELPLFTLGSLTPEM